MFNKLSDAESERLALLAEECGEVVQVVGKILRHGYESRNPVKADAETNREMLEKELGDLRDAMDLLVESKDVDFRKIALFMLKKRESVKQYLHHNLGQDSGGDIDKDTVEIIQGMPDADRVERHAIEHTVRSNRGEHWGGLWIARGPYDRAFGPIPEFLRMKVIDGRVNIQNGFSFWQPLDECRWKDECTYQPVKADGSPL